MNRIITLLFSAILMLLATASVSLAADAISLPASEPFTMYYTTNGATPAAPTSSTSAMPATPVQEVISLVPNAGKGTSYKKPEKLKIHESKYEFEKHIKQKHGKRYKVVDFSARQTENGLEGYIDIIENRGYGNLQLDSNCTDDEWGRRVAIARDFIANNPELIGLTENEELRVLMRERNNCGNIYFDRFVNWYELMGSGFQAVFRPQYNYSIYANIKAITPEMYAMAQQKSLTEEEVADIVYKDLNIVIPDKKDKSGKAAPNLPVLQMRKYLRDSEPYTIWEVRCRYAYEINAVTGEIVRKYLNRK